ncbi:bifunctional 2-polyprenyl-6-hydroxyphenol methylase/3-demethylubiquinol 3-O-methyltransferase UbiG [Stappia sp. MMSF_3263]|uniref:class I SAM-dependent methyltransferase n=1 Tax=Stappia sp. MMSF_3263 TaxID=3046693 RepID=UPI00273E3B77|nr:methyltransferase domain-containing protein [Stappia sp. MMSF_3263]
MSYENFLQEFATAQGVGSVEELLSDYSQRYAFQINSRDRAKKVISRLVDEFGITFPGKRVLDVGCAYGSFSIEMAKAGAIVVGVDISDKWLRLAEINASGEAEVPFVNCDASSYRASHELSGYGPFDIFIVNDVFEHIHDTVGLMETIKKLSSPGAIVYFKIPNGHATRHVLLEGHKKVFGISLLPPDYWHLFISAPFHIYYRRWGHFQSIFDYYGFSEIRHVREIRDPDIETTRRHIVNDVNKIRRFLKSENFDDVRQLSVLRRACRYYYDEVASDIETLEWEPLWSKYRQTFWEGVAVLSQR